MADKLQQLTQQLKQINGEMAKALSTSPLASSTRVQASDSNAPWPNDYGFQSNEDDGEPLPQVDPAYAAEMREATRRFMAAKAGDELPERGGKKTLRRRRSRRNTLRRKKNKGRVHVRS